jgi:hypothetical protein
LPVAVLVCETPRDLTETPAEHRWMLVLGPEVVIEVTGWQPGLLRD